MKEFFLRIITCMISIYAILSYEHEIDVYVVIHYIIIIISSYSLYSYSDKPYSLYKVYHIFTLFFFGIAPVLQYYDKIRFLNEPIISDEVLLQTSLIILILTISFNIFYFWFYSRSIGSSVEVKINNLSRLCINDKGFKKELNILFISVSFFCLFMLLWVNNFNFMRLVFRGGEYASLSRNYSGNKSITLLCNQFFRPLSLTLFIIYYMYNKKNRVVSVLLFFLFLITCFPTGLARNATAGFYLPLLLLFSPLFQKKNMFVSIMIGGILLIFPFLNNFRSFNANTKLSLGLDYDMFTELHFDAYKTFCRVINLDLITYGEQLLGVLFFFVPRSIWLQKPQSSGQLHADVLNLSFKNLAFTYYAEGYINFGYIGVLMFLFIIAYLSAKLDRIYWGFKKSKSFFNVIYVMILSMFLFILRGDLMNGYAYTFGTVITSILTYYILVRLMKFKY